MEAILGTIVGFVAFGIIWFFLLRPKNNQAPTDELKLKEEELPQSLQKKWTEAKYSREKYLAARYLKSNKNTIKESKGCCDNCKEEKTCCSVSEEIQPQGNIKKVLDVVKNKQHTKIGGTLIDATTAGMMAQVWDKVNDSSKEKMNKMNVKQLINLILKLWNPSCDQIIYYLDFFYLHHLHHLHHLHLQYVL